MRMVLAMPLRAAPAASASDRLSVIWPDEIEQQHHQENEHADKERSLWTAEGLHDGCSLGRENRNEDDQRRYNQMG